MQRTVTEVRKNVPAHWVGNGFLVQSLFNYSSHGREMSPFLLLDYAAPAEFPGDGTKRGVGAHPHKGFETVTIAYQGEVQHRDSSGGGGTIGAGDVQWMTAGSGILHEEFHSERFSADGGRFEMVQLWVNLPAKYKNEPPNYQTIRNTDIPVVHLSEEVSVRVIAGELAVETGPAKTYTPLELWDVEVTTAATFSLPIPEGHNAAMLVVAGRFNVSGQEISAGEMALLGTDGSELELSAQSPGKLLVLAGEPILEPIAGQGPFVMNTQAELQEAFASFRSGEFGNLEPERI